MHKPGAHTFEVVDVQKVSAQDPSTGLRTYTIGGKPKVIRCDIVIAGGGMGGVAAAMAAVHNGASVCMTEETDWIGGQMTAQGVSALDENYLVETSGATGSYLELREQIRNYYRSLPGASAQVQVDQRLNPGNCWVSRLSFEPTIGLQTLEKIISKQDGKQHGKQDEKQHGKQMLQILKRHKIVQVKTILGRIKSALALNLDTGQFAELRAKYFLDATELGDLLPLSGVPYTSGAEAKEETGEAHAPTLPNVENVQDFTYPFIVEFRSGERNIITKPPHYERFRAAGKFSFLGYKMFAKADAPGRNTEFLPFWTYRRLIATENFPAAFPNDLAMINWESNDLRGENIIDAPAQTQTERLALGKDISLGFLYWLQTEAPRDDGGNGYPELLLRPELMGTKDGLSKYPYIRECRRIKALTIVFEQDIAAATITGARARLFDDSVGIGLYPIDIHGNQDVPGAGQASRPFQIPLGALIQTTVRNLIPACKNIGTTHITNGAYRLHPIEWAIGEAAGTVAAFCLTNNINPEGVLKNKFRLRQLQKQLVENGVPIFWFDDLPINHPQFAAIQFLTAAGILSYDNDSLHARPDAPSTAGDIREMPKAMAPQAQGNGDRRPGVCSGNAGSIDTRAQLARTIYAQLAQNKINLKLNMRI
jgi:FAD dependent oxidoreductase